MNYFWSYRYPQLPTITTTSASSVTTNSAVTGGYVYKDGGCNLVVVGVCYNTVGTPTTADSKTTNGTSLGAFTSSLSGLSSGTTYYVRAYATNCKGTAYGNQITFITGSNNVPTVTTTTPTSITATTASSGGNVTSSGGATVTTRGVCYNTLGNPTTSDTIVASGSGTGSFTSGLSSLSPATTYWVRAYATNSVGTGYGVPIQFTTLPNLPTVTTTAISSIAQTTAIGGGNVTNNGGASVTERGICWVISSAGTPTTSNIRTINGTGNGTFTSNLTDLIPGTTYNVRAYATNSVGTSYGSTVQFTTSANVSLPIVTTTQVYDITTTTAYSGGTVLSSGGGTVTSRGVCWIPSSTAGEPTISDNITINGSGLGTFTSQLTGLSNGVTYKVRAYATNSVGTAYGETYTFIAILATDGVKTISLSGFPYSGDINKGIAIYMSPDGYNLYILILNNPFTTPHYYLLRFTLTNPYDIETALYNNFIEMGSIDNKTWHTIRFSKDGKRVMLFASYWLTGDSNPMIKTIILSQPWNINTIERVYFTSVIRYSTTERTTQFDFSEDGKTMFTDTGNLLWFSYYNLEIPYTLPESQINYVDQFSSSGYPANVSERIGLRIWDTSFNPPFLELLSDVTTDYNGTSFTAEIITNPWDIIDNTLSNHYIVNGLPNYVNAYSVNRRSFTYFLEANSSGFPRIEVKRLYG